jgi:alpha-beta hydrolase superfamily lysophospholipase
MKTNSAYFFKKGTKELSPAYYLLPNKSQSLKGVILFFHPGLNTDYSPRWETILNSLTYGGYIIIAPNYPMSAGYGKTFKELNFTDALKDMRSWKDTIKKEFAGLPVYYLSFSSGNLLMESCLKIDHQDISGAASLFGLSISNAIPRVPTNFIFGKNDPLINSQYRVDLINQYHMDFRNKTIIYYDEWHWFRKKENIENCLNEIIKFWKK